MLRSPTAALSMTVVAGRASSPRASDAVRAELAPAGKLRAGMNLSNTLFTLKDPASGELSGVSVDLMRELASRLGVPVEFVVFPRPGDVADASGAGSWDVALLAIEQARAQTIAFSPPLTEIDGAYVVHKDSPLRSVAQVDAPGVRISLPNKAGYELYLTRTLQKAALVRTKDNQSSIDLFKQRGAEVLAGLKPALLDAMPNLPDARMLEGKFMTVNHGIGTPRSRTAAAEYLKAFVADVNASGFVARSIGRHGIKGLSAVKDKP